MTQDIQTANSFNALNVMSLCLIHGGMGSRGSQIMFRCAIYCRISIGDLNNDNQKLQLIEYAKMKGWEYEVFEETESTRKTRPIKEAVLQAIRENKFDGILIYKLDRWECRQT